MKDLRSSISSAPGSKAVRDEPSTMAAMTALLEEALPKPSTAGHLLMAETGVGGRRERERLLERYADRLLINPLLTRQLVSYQASKSTAFHRWFKFKEAFSPALVDYLFSCAEYSSERVPHVLDPFAGTGTTLSRAAARGWRATGIEVLPVGIHAIQARFAADRVDAAAIRRAVSDLQGFDWRRPHSTWRFPHIRITRQAFPPQTEIALSAFQRYLEQISNPDLRHLLWFACLSVLEEVSFTRKDGQYLRWDHRSGRTSRRRFDKGPLSSFPEAIIAQLRRIEHDLALRDAKVFSQTVELLQGSCLKLLPTLPSAQFDLILTSPPYCNRYDYTRTYALELAFAGCDEAAIRELRQTLLSATVENRSKRAELRAYYASRGASARFHLAASACDNQAALQEALQCLRSARQRGELSNPNVPQLVENYFFEMALVIFEMARVLATGGRVFMVNDNVRYHGEEIPVDLILSDFAEAAGLKVERIWVLPRGKGNSSQQMGRWGRQELRKCVYVWTRADM